MFGSQALETAIGLVLVVFVMATLVSALAELVAKLFKLRHAGLETALNNMLNGDGAPDWKFRWSRMLFPRKLIEDGSATAKVLQKAGVRTRTSYLSAKSFADAATELASELSGGPLSNTEAMTKMKVLAREARGDLTKVKAGLETWFDESMAAAQDSYKRHTAVVLFLLGLTAAGILNVSVINVGQELWQNAAARQTTADVASKVSVDALALCKKEQEDAAAEDPEAEPPTQGETIECALDSLEAVNLGMGWGGDEPKYSEDARWWWLHVAGWFATALLVMLGAPFWFDLLGRLVALRGGAGSGARPATAPNDPGSSQSLLNEFAASGTLALYSDHQPASPARDDDYWLRKALNLPEQGEQQDQQPSQQPSPQPSPQPIQQQHPQQDQQNQQRGE